MNIKRKNDPTQYDVRDKDCIGRDCLQLGWYQHRGATASGSRSTGSETPCCMRRAYHGCPTPVPEFDPETAQINYQNEPLTPRKPIARL